MDDQDSPKPWRVKWVWRWTLGGRRTASRLDREGSASLLEQLGCERRQRVGDGVAWLEDQAFECRIGTCRVTAMDAIW